MRVLGTASMQPRQPRTPEAYGHRKVQTRQIEYSDRRLLIHDNIRQHSGANAGEMPSVEGQDGADPGY